MRTSRAHDDRVAQVTQQRLEALANELAGLRPGEAAPTVPTSTPASTPAPTAAPGAATVRPAGPASSGPGRHARRPVRPMGRLAGWVADRLPPHLRGTVHLGSAQLGLVALVMAVGLVATAWWVVRAGGAEGEVAPPRAVAAPEVAGSAPTTTAPSSAGPGGGVEGGVTGGSGLVVVDVAGRVRRPGIVVLPVGSRVVDALKAAGGVRRGVDLTAVNLARLLNDGEQVLVGATAAPGASGGVAASGSTGTSGALVNLNTADQTTLETLPGVGPVTAGAIIEWRTEHGGFTAVEELLEVPGIGDATLAELSPHVTI